MQKDLPFGKTYTNNKCNFTSTCSNKLCWIGYRMLEKYRLIPFLGRASKILRDDEKLYLKVHKSKE